MMQSPTIRNTPLRFIPHWNGYAYRYQRFFVEVQALEDGNWNTLEPHLESDTPPSAELRASCPIHCAIIDSLIAAEFTYYDGPTKLTPYFAARHLEQSTSIVQKWGRAEFLCRIQGLPLTFSPEDWARNKWNSLERAGHPYSLAHSIQLLYPPTARRTPRVARQPRSVIYLIHADPFDTETLVGYVGQTINADTRENEHLSGRDRSTSLLVATIKASGKVPTFTVLQSCASKQLDYYEKKWYGTLTAAGWKLFNEVELVSR